MPRKFVETCYAIINQLIVQITFTDRLDNMRGMPCLGFRTTSDEGMSKGAAGFETENWNHRIKFAKTTFISSIPYFWPAKYFRKYVQYKIEII